MKRNNKGFTLAELLIVIAIIAILIAIAIPVFAGQLENARLQTDHANIRSCYALAQVANLEGGLIVGDDPTPVTTGTYYFLKDGSLSTSATKDSAYILMAAGDAATKCATSAPCQTSYKSFTHTKGQAMVIRQSTDETTDGAKVGTWIVATAAAPV